MMITWMMEGPHYLFSCIHYPQTTWCIKKGDADDFACLAAELLRRWDPSCDPVLMTVIQRPYYRSHTVCVFNSPNRSLWYFDNYELRRVDCKTYEQIVVSIHEGRGKVVGWDVRDPFTLEMRRCHVPNTKEPSCLCAAQCLQCARYNVKSKLCTFLNERVDADNGKEKCDHYSAAISHAIDEYHIRSSSYYSFIAAAIFSTVPLILAYFVPAIVSAILLGLLAAFLAAMLKFAYDEFNENYRRGLRSPFFRARMLVGAVALIAAPVIQVLFAFGIIPVGYLSWILLTGGLALAINKTDIDIRQVEEGEPVEEVVPIAAASPREFESLNQRPYGINIEVARRTWVGTNTVMTVIVANNTSKTAIVELKYISPCFEPQADSVPLKLEAKSAYKIKFVVHVSAGGDYVVSARILDSEKVVTGINKLVNTKAPNRFLSPLAIVRAALGLATLIISAIGLVPDLIGLFRQ